MSGQLESFLDHVRRTHESAIPRYVEQELRAYLECGLHSFGFARAVCSSCGAQPLMAFSCKKRGACPSCNARRMCDTAAYLADWVFPAVPVRQWVLSCPYELRLTLARDPRALTKVGSILVAEVQRWMKERARQLGHDPKRVQVGAVNFPQRFGDSLNLRDAGHGLRRSGAQADDRQLG